uniref:DUF2116 family Zn-ribbon domain-containing protein n=1 Tax=Candidatus Methanomethylicus mesodigestus TaxID=1867258 RepID=A0A7C3FB93_9CREN
MSKKFEEKWGPHSHCVICGIATPEGEKLCSEICKAKYKEEEEKYKKQQKFSYLFIGIMGAVVVIMFLLSYVYG